MKKVSLFLGFAFMASMVFAQNSAIVNQVGISDNAKVAQTGVSNLATVDQIGDFNYIDVISVGATNKVDVDQVGILLNGANVGIYGYIHQWGGETNDAKLYQEGDHIDFKIDQIGDKNIATVAQVGSYLQVESKGLTQEGKSNLATINQSGGVNISLSAYQKGTSNVLTSNQSGSYNEFTATQDGDANEATITQYGSNNLSDLFNPTSNLLYQKGTGNDATITQGGNSQFIVNQIGDLNMATVVQMP